MQGWDFENNQYYLSFALKWFHFHLPLSLSLINTTHLHSNYNFHFSSAGKCCWLETNRILSIWERSSCTKEKHLPASTKLHFLRWFSKLYFPKWFSKSHFPKWFSKVFLCWSKCPGVGRWEPGPSDSFAQLFRSSGFAEFCKQTKMRLSMGYHGLSWVIMGYQRGFESAEPWWLTEISGGEGGGSEDQKTGYFYFFNFKWQGLKEKASVWKMHIFICGSTDRAPF